MRRSALVIVAAVIAGLVPATTAASAPIPGHNRHDRALAEAQAMIASAPVLDGSTSVAAAPNKHLKHPASYPAINGLVKLGAWWTVDENWQSAFTDLTGTTPNGYKASGTGTAGRINQPPYLTYDTYDPVMLPDGIYYAELLLEVSPLSKTRTGVAAFANVVATKPRPADEFVPSDVTSVTLTRQRHSGGTHPATRMLQGDAAAKLVNDFNDLLVDPGGVTSCPANPEVIAATFIAEGHTWVATSGCPGESVTLDGGTLPYLASSAAYSNDLSRAFRPHH